MSAPHATKARVAVRLAAGFALLVALATALGLYCLRGFDARNELGDPIATHWLPAMQALSEYRKALGAMRRAEANYVMVIDPAPAQLELQRISAARRQADAAWNAYRRTIADDDELRLATRAEAADARYRAAQERLLRIPLGGRPTSDALRDALLSASPEIAQVDDALGDLVDYQQRGVQLAQAAATRDHNATRELAVGLVIAAVSVAAIVALLTAASIGRDVTALRQAYESALQEESLRSSELERARARLLQAEAQLAHETRNREAAEQRLARLDRGQDEFIATVAHELRGPLSGLLSAAAMLRVSSGAETMRERAAQIVDRQWRHMSRLADDLTDAAQLVTGRLSLRMEEVELATAIGAAVDLVAPKVAERRQRVYVAIEAGTRCQIIGDSGRLVQVLTTLLGIASRHTPEDGRIDVDLSRDGADAVVRVRDTGVGIPPAMVDRVLNMFEQGGKPPGSGAGLDLALALARQLARLHGGRLSVDSSGLRGGACFTLRLPLVAGLSSGSSTAASRSPAQ